MRNTDGNKKRVTKVNKLGDFFIFAWSHTPPNILTDANDGKMADSDELLVTAPFSLVNYWFAARAKSQSQYKSS